MANSKFEYIRLFETPDSILPDTWIVIRIDGRGFHKLSAKYEWQKPNDERAIRLMNEAAKAVMREIQDLTVAYGQSDEYSFVFPPSTTLFDRRASKLTSTLLSTFTSYYTHLWPSYFPDTRLSSPLPTFDARHIVYPTTRHVRDYLSWRQADCHINNLYNTTFWTLVQKEGMSAREAEERLKGTLSGEKNEILWKHGCNYNEVEGLWRKGSVIWRDYNEMGKHDKESERVFEKEKLQNQDEVEESEEATAIPQLPTRESPQLSAESTATAEVPIMRPQSQRHPQPSSQPSQPFSQPSQPSTSTSKPAHQPQAAPPSSTPLSKTQQAKHHKQRQKATITISHVDIIKDAFWGERPWILGQFP